MQARILIIEDNAANLELMSYLLRSSGCIIAVATNGASGLELAKRDPPHLILCDIQLPDLNGTEVVTRMRLDPKLTLVPIVAVTAYAMVGDRENYLAAGFDGYITKPIAPETFVEEVQDFLPRELRWRKS